MIVEDTLDEVWKKLEIFQKYTRSYLFGITSTNRQQLEKYQQKYTIIQFLLKLQKIYPPKYNFHEKELRTWQAMFVAYECTNITSISKNELSIEFWSKALNPSADKELLQNLHKNTIRSNKRGSDSKIHILSMIALKFKYHELIEELQ
ncbi:6677_t:CDS:2, partial [Racocetra persica]